jgi:sugar phosphate isomerase/epimerase
MERFAVCQFTTMDTTFEEDIALAQEFGLGGIGICEAKIRAGEDEALLELFLDSGLVCTSVLPGMLSPLPTVPAGLYPGSENPADRVERMLGNIERLAPFRPETIVFSTGAEVGRTRTEATDIALDGFRVAARRAADLGLEISIEPVRDVGFNASFLRRMQETLDFMDLVDEPNLLLCFDMYHLWDDPDVLRLSRENGARIGAVQVNDWHEPPRARADRLLPGDGVMDLPAMLGALDDGGYRGWYDLEIFSDDGRWGSAVPDSVWAMDPRDVYRRAIEGFDAAWAARTTTATEAHS